MTRIKPPDVAGSPKQNGLWAVAQQVTTLVFTGAFSIVLVRFVSVSDFGTYSYAVTLASLGVAVMASGLQGLAIRELRIREQDSARILASLFLIREVMALVVYVGFALFALASADQSVVAVTIVACLAVIARVLDAPELWFQARLRTKEPALVRIGTAVLFFALRLGLLFWAPTVMGLIVLFVAEQDTNGVLISVQYRRATGTSPFQKAEGTETRALARHATPLAISGIANQINLRADIVIIQAMSGSTSVGLYAAAARLSEILYILPTSYMSATFPSLLDVREKFGNRSAEYRQQLQRGFDAAFWFGILAVIGTLATADWLVPLLFGADYAESATVLKVHVLACPFVFMAAILSKWIVAEGLLWLSLVRHGVGAALSIALNIALIPEFGIVGSAWATVIAYSSASYLFCFFGRSTLGVALMMTLAPFAPIRLLLHRLRKGFAK